MRQRPGADLVFLGRQCLGDLGVERFSRPWQESLVDLAVAFAECGVRCLVEGAAVEAELPPGLGVAHRKQRPLSCGGKRTAVTGMVTIRFVQFPTHPSGASLGNRS